ncbi:MAG: protein translocase subunit SecD [Agathobacter sp.]|nr:protein translocase subunit SecD [Agathobacter sp.]
MKKNKAYAIIAIILAAVIGLGIYAVDVLKATTSKGDNGIILGLDLSGGVSITYQIMTENPTQTEINDTIAKMEERAENYSTEYAVYQVGEDRITVEIPGVFDANAVLEELGSPGALYFIRETNANGDYNYSYDETSEEKMPYALNYSLEELIANGSVILTGNDVKAAEAGYQPDQYGNQAPIVSMSFTDEATEIFAEETKRAALSGETIAIYYDDHFISVPMVEEAITNGQCVISGSSTYADAEELATFIRIGAISLKLEELESNVVGAQLGSQALINSIKAAAIGLLLIMLFMIVTYRLSGVVSAISLSIYTFATILLIQLAEITLTLPGIAGIILGIGMAVDANVIIYARIKEEIAFGKTVSMSIKEGYKKAMSAILDGNVTTFIAAFVLMALGSGTVKGFAYTLMISIVMSMFTALVVAKYLMQALYAVGFRDEKFYGRAKEVKTIDFMKRRGLWFVISIATIVAGIAGMLYFGATTGNALNYGIEFAGGTSTTADFGKEYTIEQIENEIVPHVSAVTKDAAVQAVTVDDSTEIVLKTRTLSLEEREALNMMLVETFGVEESTISSQSISSTVSNEMRQDAIVAVIVACIAMLIYIRFRFQDIRFAASSIIALIHDVLVVLAAYGLLRITVGNTLIACVLTIVGYSINNTIVVFDRIRENMSSTNKQTPQVWYEVANRSLTQTLTRSINTTITTFVMVLLLYILGVPAIKEFALPLMVGLMAGTYSSLFIATELWYEMKVRIKQKAK